MVLLKKKTKPIAKNNDTFPVFKPLDEYEAELAAALDEIDLDALPPLSDKDRAFFEEAARNTIKGCANESHDEQKGRKNN